MSEWWSAVSGVDLEQGDLLHDFPISVVQPVEQGEPGYRSARSVSVEIQVMTGVVITQTCDLAQGKVNDVLVARVVPWHAFAEAQYRAGNTNVISGAYINNLIQGNIQPIALLGERQTRPQLNWSIVDFRELVTPQRSAIDGHNQEPGHRTRLRLRSPYKEHLAQAFARYFMRVGLLHDATLFATAAKRETAHLTTQK